MPDTPSPWSIEIESNLEDLTMRIEADDLTREQLRDVALELCVALARERGRERAYRTIAENLLDG